MKIESIGFFLATEEPEAKVTHKNDELRFNIRYYFNKNRYRNTTNEEDNDTDMFEHLNRYWATLPEPMQDSIFELYKKIRNAFDTINFDTHKAMLTRILHENCVALLNMHNVLDDDKPFNIHDWVILKSNIIVSDRFEATYDDSPDRQYTRDGTYTRVEYTELIAMTIAFRSMVPIWGEYINQSSREHGNKYKEYFAFQLIDGADILESKPADKLRRYIANITNKHKDNPSFIVDYLSSEDQLQWIVATTVIVKLCKRDLRGLDPQLNIVTGIFKYVIQRVEPSRQGMSSDIKEKRRDEMDLEYGDKMSTLERYRNKYTISHGEIAEMEFSIRDLKAVAYALAPLNMTDDLFYSSQQTVQKLNNFEIRRPQITLLQWVFKPIISHKGLEYMEKRTIVNCLGVLEAVLIANKFPYLGLLSTCYALTYSDEIHTSSTETTSRITTELNNKLNALYPHLRTKGGKKADAIKYENAAVESINILDKEIRVFPWTMTASADKIEAVLGARSSLRLEVKNDSKIQLANLVIAIGSRQFY